MPDRHPAPRGQPQARADHAAPATASTTSRTSRAATRRSSTARKCRRPAGSSSSRTTASRSATSSSASTTSACVKPQGTPAAHDRRSAGRGGGRERDDDHRGDAGQGQRPAVPRNRPVRPAPGPAGNQHQPVARRSTSTRCSSRSPTRCSACSSRPTGASCCMLDDDGRPVPEGDARPPAGARTTRGSAGRSSRRRSTRCSRT